MIINLLGIVYVLTASWMSVYGLLGLLTLWLYWRHQEDEGASAFAQAPKEWPPVTVQLPVFNEPSVIERLIKAAVALDYPLDKLQVQVVDDSTDETVGKTAVLVTRYQQQGINIQHIHRSHRQGYKAGALERALQSAIGEFIAIFDADFQPAPDFLKNTIPHFLDNPQVGLVQTRWGHLNYNDSPLTAAQAIALDKHFMMEQTVRFRANLFPKFNGTGGVWRRACMDDSEGWQHDTVCEDLCLSTRAILKGWQMHFLPKVIAPAELPATMSAYKIQQGRWSKGSLQCFLKYGRSIITATEQTLLARIYAVLAMTGYITQPLLLLLLLLQVPLLAAGYIFSPNMILISIAGIGQPILFIIGQHILHPDWWQRLRYFPALLLISIGIAPSNSRSMAQVFYNKLHPFHRTPKGTEQKKRPFDPVIFVELFFTLYAAFGLVIAWRTGNYGFMLFLTACVIGFSYVTFLTLRDTLPLVRLKPVSSQQL